MQLNVHTFLFYIVHKIYTSLMVKILNKYE
jgi:hypothetical protein